MEIHTYDIVSYPDYLMHGGSIYEIFVYFNTILSTVLGMKSCERHSAYDMVCYLDYPIHEGSFYTVLWSIAA